MLLIAAGSLVTGRYLAAAPRLPAPALDSLVAHAAAVRGVPAAGLRLLEVRRIGPDIAVIYRTGQQPGAALLTGGREEWTVSAEAGDPGPLAVAAGRVGAADLVANDLHIVFLAIGDARVGQVFVRFPDDGMVLKAPRHGDYSIVWRPAASVPSGFVIETYDRRGMRLNR